MDCPHKNTHKIGIDYEALLKLQQDTSNENAVVVIASVSKTVCGLPWILDYIETLPPSLRSQVTSASIQSTFDFGEVGETSFDEVTIPLLNIDENPINVRVSVVNSDIPMLLSRLALAKASTTVDSHTETLTMCGELIHYNVTEEGLMYFLLTADYSDDHIDLEQLGSYTYDALSGENPYQAPPEHCETHNLLQDSNRPDASFLSVDKTYYRTENYGHPDSGRQQYYEWVP
jgi:hypothetical protein